MSYQNSHWTNMPQFVAPHNDWDSTVALQDDCERYVTLASFQHFNSTDSTHFHAVTPFDAPGKQAF